MDFPGLNQKLLGHGIPLLQTWLPEGRRRGREYVVSGLHGGKGESLSVNTATGAWADFATGAKGGDLISLYAAINNKTQGEAYKELGGQEDRPQLPASVVKPTVRPELGKPPVSEYPDTKGAEAVYEYKDGNGDLLFCVVRYPDKKFRPFSWDIRQKIWVQRGWSSPRPLFGLECLAEKPNAAVLVVEGEKACLAARALTSAYVCVTWANGAAAVETADWSPLRGRRVLIWPDADQAGIAARVGIVKALQGLASEIKYLNVDDLPKGFDAADLTTDDWTAWARPRVVQVAETVEAPAETATATVTLVDDHAPLPASVALLCETYGLAVKGKSGLPVANIENVSRVLSVIPGFSKCVWWDDFYEGIRTDIPRSWVGADIKAPGGVVRGKARDWTDADTLGLTMRFQRFLGFQGVTQSTVLEAVMLTAHSERRCEPADWMRSLVWDGKPRLETWMVNHLGVRDNEYTRAVSKNFFLSLVARTMRPGCQVDTMLVLEGVQGAGKSSLFNAIAGDWYAEASESVMSKDFFMVLRGKILIEVAELDAFSKADVTRIKQILSCRSDRYREPYGRISLDHPRRSVFVGTTNESQYLRDPTGARRFWPIEASMVDLEGVRQEREQLFAEAVSLFEAGASWWAVPSEAAIAEAESRRVHDEIEGHIADHLEGRSDVTVHQIWVEFLGRSAERLDRHMQWRIGQALRALGWKNKVTTYRGVSTRVWNKIQG